MLAKHVVCLVRRDMAEAIPTTVFEHEVEILRDIHGDANVDVVDTLPDNDAVEIDAAEEMDRLTAYYGMNDAGQPHAERVYGRTYKNLEALTEPAKTNKSKSKEAEPGGTKSLSG